MKYILILAAILTFSFCLEAQIVDIPDIGFKDALISQGVDTNNDGEIQVSEAEGIDSLYIDGISYGVFSLDGIKSFKNLTVLTLFELWASEVDISGMFNLEELNVSATEEQSLIAVGCTALKRIDGFFHNGILIDLTDCSSLEYIEGETCARSLQLTNCTNLERLEIGSCQLDDLDISGCVNLNHFYVDTHGIIDVSGLADAKQLDTFVLINGPSDARLDFIDFPNLSYIRVDGANEFSAHNCPMLHKIEIFFSANTIDLENLPSLNEFWVSTLAAESFRMVNCPSISSLNLDFLETRNLIIQNCISITDLDIPSAIMSDSCDFSNMSALKNLSILMGPGKLILDGCYSLETFTIGNYSDARIYNFASCINLKEVDLGACYNLETLILQNGTMENITFTEPFVLSNVCVDPDEIVEMQTFLSTFPDLDAQITTSCEFANSGKPFKISGNSILDINNDSCKTSDVVLPFSKYKIVDDVIGERFFFSDSEGKYEYNMFEGQYTYGPDFLFGDYIFTASPETKSIEFPIAGSNVIQDFCFIPNPAEVDVIEVHLIPLDVARPGFDCRYLITYTNTGNVTRGGDIKLTFQDEFMDLVSSEPMVDVVEDGFLSWSFEDLFPYETRSIAFTMNLNSPMETPPLNGGEVLDFTAEVGPLGNQTLTVYWSYLNQEVVNSFDPNDKTCLNGSTFDKELVGDYLKYMIRFENTGTAEAVNIVVTDTLDNSKLDIRTLQVINSSHEVETELTDNVIKFIFRDIYLPFEDATNDGYVTFKIKTLPTLELGDDIRNKAEIFFDFNFPIVTNTTSTIISDFTSTVDIKNKTFDMDISPNPASEKIFVHAEDQIYQIQIFDISGRLIRGISFIGNKSTYELKIDQLNEGVYFIKAYSENGYSVEKFIKE